MRISMSRICNTTYGSGFHTSRIYLNLDRNDILRKPYEEIRNFNFQVDLNLTVNIKILFLMTMALTYLDKILFDNVSVSVWFLSFSSLLLLLLLTAFTQFWQLMPPVPIKNMVCSFLKTYQLLWKHSIFFRNVSEGKSPTLKPHRCFLLLHITLPPSVN